MTRSHPQHHRTPPKRSFAELADTLSMAFLLVLERLSPAERAAFLLREVFDYDYARIAEILGRSETACRQLVGGCGTSRVRGVCTAESRPAETPASAESATRSPPASGPTANTAPRPKRTPSSPPAAM